LMIYRKSSPMGLRCGDREAAGSTGWLTKSLCQDPDNPARRLTAFVLEGLGDYSVDRVGAYLGTGVTVEGIFAGRTGDELGLAVASARNGSHYISTALARITADKRRDGDRAHLPRPDQILVRIATRLAIRHRAQHKGHHTQRVGVSGALRDLLLTSVFEQSFWAALCSHGSRNLRGAPIALSSEDLRELVGGDHAMDVIHVLRSGVSNGWSTKTMGSSDRRGSEFRNPAFTPVAPP
jgi:hypothetical protein